jgi:hypothetical protein
MTEIRVAARMLLMVLAALVSALGSEARAQGQVYTPQSAAGLTVSFQSEKMGGSRVLVFGEVRNNGGATYERVILLAEGLDDTGKVVSRGRGYVSGTVPPGGTAPFELRLLAAGTERRYRVQVESYQQVQN